MSRRWKQFTDKVAGRLDEPGLSVAALIDVCFLLLIYFMVTTTIKPAERDIATEVPAEGNLVQPPRSQTVMIEVRADGVIVVNPGSHELVVSVDPAERELPKLVDHLEMMMIGGSDLPPVMVRAAGEAPHQRVMDVMNALEKTGWTRVGFLDEAERPVRK